MKMSRKRRGKRREGKDVDNTYPLPGKNGIDVSHYLEAHPEHVKKENSGRAGEGSVWRSARITSMNV